MIVVDSSVLIDHLRGVPSAQVALWQRLVRENDDQILIGDLVLLEVLQGVRDARQAAAVEAALCAFQTAPMLDPVLAVAGASHDRHLRSLGITIRRTVDLVIGTFCIVRNHMLLHCDRDFEPPVFGAMCRHLGLRTLASFPN
jgi:predicted nucleic acid-binding protein